MFIKVAAGISVSMLKGLTQPSIDRLSSAYGGYAGHLIGELRQPKMRGGKLIKRHREMLGQLRDRTHTGRDLLREDGLTARREKVYGYSGNSWDFPEGATRQEWLAGDSTGGMPRPGQA